MSIPSSAIKPAPEPPHQPEEIPTSTFTPHTVVSSPISISTSPTNRRVPALSTSLSSTPGSSPSLSPVLTNSFTSTSPRTGNGSSVIPSYPYNNTSIASPTTSSQKVIYEPKYMREAKAALGMAGYTRNASEESAVPGEIAGRTIAPDDSEIDSRLPSVAVDYLSHKFGDDMSDSWKAVSRSKHALANGIRLENASWRAWAKQRGNLRTMNPQGLNWMKESDVTWLYGPLHTSSIQAVPPIRLETPASQRLGLDSISSIPQSTSSLTSAIASNPYTSTARARPSPAKPILKHRSLYDILLPSPSTSFSSRSRTPNLPINSASSHVFTKSSIQNSPGLEQAGMDFVIGRSRSDGNLASLGSESTSQFSSAEDSRRIGDREEDSEVSPFTPMDSSAIATDSSRASSTSRPTTNSGPPTPTTASKSTPKRHISFNKFVEQRISINAPEPPQVSKNNTSAYDLDRVQEASWQAEDGDGDTEDGEVGEGGVVWFRAQSIRKKVKKPEERRRSDAAEREIEETRGRSQSKTIAWFSPTTLKNIDSWGTDGKNPVVVRSEGTIIQSSHQSSAMDGLVDERYQDWESGQSTPTLSVKIDPAYSGDSTFVSSSSSSTPPRKTSRRSSSSSVSPVKTSSSPSLASHANSGYTLPQDVSNSNLQTRMIPAGGSPRQSGSSNPSPKSKFSDPAGSDSDLGLSDDELMPMPTIASTLRAVFRTSIALGRAESDIVLSSHGATATAKGKGKKSKLVNQGGPSADERGRSSSRSSSEDRSPSRTSFSDRRSNSGLGLGLVRSDSQDTLATVRGEGGTSVERELFKRIPSSAGATTTAAETYSQTTSTGASTSTRYSASSSTPYYFSEDDDIGFGYYDSADDESTDFSIIARGKEVFGTVRDLLGAFKQGIWG